MTKPTISYYATRDPDDDRHMTLWRRTGAGELVPFEGQLKLDRARIYATAKGAAWKATIIAQIDADPHAAARDFAELGKCCVCVRMLKDRDDQAVGIHRTCRNAMDPIEAAEYVAALLAAHGVEVEASHTDHADCTH